MIDFKSIGRHMSRQRYQRGSLKRVGKTRKMWRGRWHVYIKRSDGSEKLCKREKILGLVAQLTKGQAQEKLDALIKASTDQISGNLRPDLTLGELWKAYSGLKSASWSTATRKTVTSVFSGDTQSKKRPSILALIGE